MEEKTHEPIVISGISAQIFKAREAWEHYRKNNNIVNPYHRIREIQNNFWHYTKDKDQPHVTHIKVDNYTEEAEKELQKWKDMRAWYDHKSRLWIGQYLLENYGYDTLYHFAKNSEQIKDGGFQEWFMNVRPCEGKDHECIMFCCDFEDCKGERIYGNN